MVGELEPGHYCFRNEKALGFLEAILVVVDVEKIACFPDAAFDNPLQFLTALDGVADDEGLDTAVRVQEDVAASTAVQSVDDTTAVTVEAAQGAAVGEKIENGG
jgi:hypothetical protein